MCIAIISCNTINKKNASTCMTININNSDNISIFDIFSKIKIIPLETTDKSLISHISKILTDQNHIYILDQRQGQIFIFDKKGNYFSKIDKKGRGPEEYITIEDFKINPFTQNLEVLDPMGKFFIFDTNGKYIQSFRLPKTLNAYHEFINLNTDSIVFYTSSEEYNLNIYSRSLDKIVDQSFKSKKKLDINTPITSFYRFHDTIYFSQYLYDEIYHITDKGIHLDYEWFFPDYDYNPDEVIPNYDRNNAKDYFSIQKLLPYVYINNLQNSLYKYTCISPNSDKKYISIFYNKKTGKNIVFEKTTEGIIFTPYLLNDSIALSPIEPWRKSEEYINSKVLDSDNLEILRKLSENDNPILIEYTLKKE